MISKRSFSRKLFVSSLFVGLAMIGVQSHAQSFPSKPIRLIVPFAPGSGSDNIARKLVDMVGTQSGWTFIIDNKVGASGLIGAQEFKRSAADGYTLFYGGNSTHGANSALFKSLPYDPINDFAPLTRVGTWPLVLMPRPNLGVDSLNDLVKMAKAKPDSLTFPAASAGPRVASETFIYESKISARYIPYKSSPQAVTDLIGGHVDFLFIDSVSAIPFIKAGTLKGLAVTSSKRIDSLPQVATMAELGYPKFEVPNWSAVFAPKAVPADIQQSLYKAFATTIASAEWKKFVSDLGGYADSYTPEQTAAFIDSEIRSYKTVLGRAGVIPE